MQVDAVKNNRPSFTGYTPFKVFVNGHFESDPKIIKKVAKAFYDELKQGNSKVFYDFRKTVIDYKNAKRYGGGELKSYVDEHCAYLVSGLDIKKFVWFKNYVKDAFNFPKAIRTFISNQKGKLTELDPVTRIADHTKPLKLVINAKSSNIKGKLVIETISFERETPPEGIKKMLVVDKPAEPPQKSPESTISKLLQLDLFL